MSTNKAPRTHGAATSALPRAVRRAPPDTTFRAAFDVAISGMAFLDVDGRIRRGNPALATMLGATEEQFAGRMFAEFVGAEDRAKVDSAFLRLREPGSRAMQFALMCQGSDGRTAWTDCNLTRLCAGDAGDFIVELRDISAWRQSEDDLVWAQAQLVHQEKMASIGLLAAGVAHEINNPLGYVHSNLGTLSDYLCDVLRLVDAYEEIERSVAPEAPAWEGVRSAKRCIDLDYMRKDLLALVDDSKAGMQRMEKIVRDLRDFSRAESSEEWTFADLHRGLDSTLNIVNHEIKYKTTVEKNYGNLPLVECRSSQLNQVFMNLLVNAGQAIPERGVIHIATGVEGDEVWIDISDTGAGIPPALMPRIFDPFFTTKPAGAGTGLGLSLSYGIVKRHGGRIEVDSAIGCGTRFRVRLPIRQPPGPAAAGSEGASRYFAPLSNRWTAAAG